MRRYRRGLQVGLLMVIAAFIASLFVFGQRGFGDGAGRDAVATVNGESIPLARYQQRYQAFMEAYARIYRDRFSPELAERLGLPQQVVNELIQEALIVQRAGAEGLLVTDEELNAQIQAVPAFQESGRFALKRYQEYVRRRGLAAAAFENEMRRELTRMKVEQAVRGGVKVTPAEVEHAFVLRREEARAAWALVEFGPLIAAASASDDELGKYLGAHQDEFRQPERRRILSVTLTPKDFLKSVADAAVEQYYREHPKEFEEPRRVHAAHVLARVPETGGSDAEDSARTRVPDVIRRAKAGEDSARLAAEISEDPGSKSKGGDLGWISKGEMVPAFEAVAFTLRRGEISPEAVRSPFGFHAIKVFESRAAGKKPLKEVAAQIRDRLAAEAADKAARAKADEVRPPLQAATDFVAEARRLGLTPIETTMSRMERLPMLGGTDPLEEAAFALAIGGVSSPVKTAAGWVVLKSTEAIPAGVPPLTEIRDRVAGAVKRQKAEAIALERAHKVVAETGTKDLAAAARIAGAQTGETARFSRTKPAERLPGDVQLAALQSPAGTVAGPRKSPQGYYVLKVLERIAPNMADLAAERDRLSREVLTQKQSQAWEAWVSHARAAAKVEVLAAPKRS